MSDLSETVHNLADLITGKTDFNGFMAGEGKLIAQNIASLPAVAQPFAQIVYSAFKAGASSLVGLGETALGPIVAASSDTQATMVLNLMTAAGIPTQGPLSIAERAALVQIFNGLHAMLDRMHLHIAAPTPVPTQQSAPQGPPAPAAPLVPAS